MAFPMAGDVGGPEAEDAEKPRSLRAVEGVEMVGEGNWNRSRSRSFSLPFNVVGELRVGDSPIPPAKEVGM